MDSAQVSHKKLVRKEGVKGRERRKKEGKRGQEDG